MNRNLIILLLIFLSKLSNAQQELLSFDEHNKYIYYGVNEMQGLSADTLHNRGLLFLKTLFPRVVFKSPLKNINILCDGKFLTYSSSSVFKHEQGEVNYSLNIEFKDEKYRFWLTNFTYKPYERDRYGNFVPKLGKEIALEFINNELSKKESDAYLNETGLFCKQFAERLKIYLLNIPKKEEKLKKIVTDKW